MIFELVPAAVERAQGELLEGLRAAGATTLPAKVAEAVTRRAVRAYLAEAEQHVDKPKNRHHLRPQTKALMAQQPYDVFEGDLETSATWCGRMQTVRRRMNNPAMRWTIDLASGRSVITRMPDGTDTHRPSHGKQTLALAAMAIGDTISWPGTRLETSTKNSARKIIGDGRAEWKRWRTNKGLRIKRIA